MKFNKEIGITLLVVISFLGLLSNTIVFRSYIYQQKTVKDMTYQVPRLSLEESKKLNLNYPNINIYTVPFKTHLGRVYLRDSMYDEAIASFHDARKANPFLVINENYLAETYQNISELDSFKFYAKKIFKTAPNHPGHFAHYIKSLGSLQYSDKIDSAFSEINIKSTTLWKIYLAAIYNVDSIKDKGFRNIRLADSIYKKEKQIQYFIDAIRYGQKNLDKSEELISVSDKLAQINDFESAIVTLKEALNFYPTNNSIFNKLATSYYKVEKYDSSLYYLNKINLEKFEDQGRYYLIEGINLVNLNKKEEGCNAIYKSIILGNKEAIKASNSFCK